ncbi:MAG: very short patch repair endonuclease [Microbacterium sp.]|nr:very short patch repair endonuclease [Microbacterium sp.]
MSALEIRFRKAVWAAGARGYRVRRRLPGRPDLVFPAVRLAIFVHGCFWHRCEVCRLPEPKANAEFWRDKLTQNVNRDAAATLELERTGWKPVVVWEHELRKDLHGVAARVAAQVVRMRGAHG